MSVRRRIKKWNRARWVQVMWCRHNGGHDSIHDATADFRYCQRCGTPTPEDKK